VVEPVHGATGVLEGQPPETVMVVTDPPAGADGHSDGFPGTVMVDGGGTDGQLDGPAVFVM
jgi:hypothetical protein